jgi:hypothetical protein
MVSRELLDATRNLVATTSAAAVGAHLMPGVARHRPDVTEIDITIGGEACCAQGGVQAGHGPPVAQGTRSG